jgi:hypothetical protein
MTSDMIYEDSLVSINNEEIIFKMYYFPFGKKRVTLSDVKYIETKTPTLLNGKWRIWGTGDFITWFPCDSSRPIRDTIFIAHIKNRIVRIGFTVEESRPVIDFFSERGLLRSLT